MRPIVRTAVFALCAVWLTPVHAAQIAFASPEQAMAAFGDALARSDDERMKALLGNDYRALIPPVGTEVRYRFLAAWAQSHSVRHLSDVKAAIAVGEDGWTLPIPIIKTAQGWRLDTRAGAEEMRLRRIGRNERAVMQVMLAIYDAQKEYALQDPDGDGVPQYATRFASSPGRRDGLFWRAKAGESPSPLGPAVSLARAAGGDSEAGFFGYRYRILAGQGEHAPGGSFDYVVNGRMIGGFAVLAWPVRYGDTGVMSFIVSHDGVLYEKDLGRDTPARAKRIARFNPDATWRKAHPES
jgi:hypothetical protein